MASAIGVARRPTHGSCRPVVTGSTNRSTIRNRKPGYAVSIIKAGARVVGKSAGAVRPPLVDPSAEEEERLKALVTGLGEALQ